MNVPDDPADACESCVTCGDVAVPVRIARLLPDGLALADTGDGIEEISVALVAARPPGRHIRSRTRSGKEPAPSRRPPGRGPSGCPEW
ncbi:hypothetical protein AB0J43_60395, partial [Nonomuraea fuscirosea]